MHPQMDMPLFFNGYRSHFEAVWIYVNHFQKPKCLLYLRVRVAELIQLRQTKIHQECVASLVFWLFLID